MLVASMAGFGSPSLCSFSLTPPPLQIWRSWRGVHRAAQRHRRCHPDPIPARSGELGDDALSVVLNIYVMLLNLL